MLALHSGRIGVVGYTQGPVDLGLGAQANDGTDIFLAAYEVDFSPVWGRVVGGAGTQLLTHAGRAQNGDILVAGNIAAGSAFALGAGVVSDPGGPNGGFVARIAPTSGLATASRAMSGFDQVHTVAEDGQGDVVIGGGFTEGMLFGGYTYADVTTQPQADSVAVKLSPDLSQVAWKQRGAMSSHWEIFTGAAFDPVGAVFLAGKFNDVLELDGCDPQPSVGDSDVFVMLRRP